MNQPPFTMETLLQNLHEGERLNAPARDAALDLLRDAFDGDPDPGVLTLYRDHDGSAQAVVWRGKVLAVRTMPIDEALNATATLEGIVGAAPGKVFWMWTDDNSNYAGVFTSGPLRGFVTVLSRDEPQNVPRFRSPLSFMKAVVAGCESSEPPCDLPMVDCDLPVTADDASSVQLLRELAADMLVRWRKQSREGTAANDARRMWASAALCLLPAADTHLALELLDDQDMWTPEKAVLLLEIRRYLPAVPSLERLAREGSANGNGAAIRALVRFGTPEAREAIARLENVLSGQKRSLLDMYRRVRLTPPRW